MPSRGFRHPSSSWSRCGQFGRKSGGGYYRVRKAADGGKLKDVFRLESDSWQPAGPARLGACHAEIETLFFGADAAAGASCATCSAARLSMPQT